MPEQVNPTQGVRGMDHEGRPTDGRSITPGDRVLTRFGTPTTPYPHQRHERYASQWLIDNAVAHASAAGDRFNATVFSGERPNKAGYLPPASVACMQTYLFDRSFPTR
jgi:hypothetical protein